MAIKEIVKGICNITRCKYDVYTKEKTDELLNNKANTTDVDLNYLAKKNIFVLTGDLEVSDGGITSAIKSYPKAMSLENCAILCVLTQPYNANGPTDYWAYDNVQGGIGCTQVTLKSDGIHIDLYKNGPLDNGNFSLYYTGLKYKIIVMNIW